MFVADMSVGDQLQRAAMGGEKERAELAAFEALLSKCIADAFVAGVRKEGTFAFQQYRSGGARIGGRSGRDAVDCSIHASQRTSCRD